MPKLSDRMMRADTLADGRLLRVSPSARLLAVVLEALAEPTGVLKADADEIRSVAPFYLANAAGKPPTTVQITKWTAELIASRWCIEYKHEGVRLLYLHGFGTRQQSPYLAIGISPTTGEVARHIPTPPCVRDLRARDEKGSGPRKLIPIHCESDWANCPCDLLSASGTLPAPLGHRKEVDLDVDPELKELDAMKGSASRKESLGGGTPDPAALLIQMLEQSGTPFSPEDVQKRVASWLQSLSPEAIISAAKCTTLAPADTFLARIAHATATEGIRF
jgi:hypothetical protein